MVKNMIKFGIYSKIALKLNSNPKFIQFLIVFFNGVESIYIKLF